MKIISYLLIGIVVIGCEILNFPKDSLARLRNDSDYNLKIMVFEDGKLFLDTLSIGKNEFLERIVAPNGNHGSYLPINSDSIVVVFNSKKILTQSCTKEKSSNLASGQCKVINNLVAISDLNIEKFKSGKYEQIITHVITQSDYDRAVDL